MTKMLIYTPHFIPTMLPFVPANSIHHIQFDNQRFTEISIIQANQSVFQSIQTKKQKQRHVAYKVQHAPQQYAQEIGDCLLLYV